MKKFKIPKILILIFFKLVLIQAGKLKLFARNIFTIYFKSDIYFKIEIIDLLHTPNIQTLKKSSNSNVANKLNDVLKSTDDLDSKDILTSSNEFVSLFSYRFKSDSKIDYDLSDLFKG